MVFELKDYIILTSVNPFQHWKLNCSFKKEPLQRFHFSETLTTFIIFCYYNILW